MFSLKAMPSQEGKISIVTGANIGLGFETVKGLISKGSKVILASRNEEKAKHAISEIEKEFPGADMEIMLLDLSSKESIKSFAKQYFEKYDKLDILVNNAGIMIPPYRETVDGFESQWAVNYLGHFYLTALLMPLLEKAQEGRVVTVSSLAHISGLINFEDPNHKDNYQAMVSYRQSKLACLIFAYELQRRLGRQNSTVKSMGAHPGVAVTNILANGPTWIKILTPLLSWMFHSVKKAAEPQLMAALDPSLTGGEYLGPMSKRGMRGKPGIVRSNSISKDEEVAKQLWDLSERQLGFKFEF